MDRRNEEWYLAVDSGPESGFGAQSRDGARERGNPFVRARGAQPESGRGSAEGESPTLDRQNPILEILRQNAEVMRLMREEREEARRAESERTGLLVETIERLTRDRRVVQAQNPPAPIQATNRNLTSLSLGLLIEFNGEGMSAANEWISKLEDIGTSYGWTPAEHRQAACTKLIGSALDWHMAVGRNQDTWVDWRRSFLAAFGRPLSMDQFVVMARSRVRAPSESIRGFCYAMQRICARSPIPLDEPSVIRYMLLGLNDANAESALVAAQPATLEHFYELVRALEMHRMDRAPLGHFSQYFSTVEPESHTVNVSRPPAGIENSGASPVVQAVRDPLAALLERMDRMEAEIKNAGGKRSTMATSPATSTQTPGPNSWTGWRTSTPANTGPPPSVSFSPRRGAGSPARSATGSPTTRSVSFGPTTTFAEPRTCFACNRRGHIAANCPGITEGASQPSGRTEN